MTHSSAPATTSSTTSSTKTLGLTALIVGAASAVLSWLILPILWLLGGVVAVVLGFLSRRKEPAARTLALWGIILGFVAIISAVASMVIGAMILAQAMSGA
jgi:uncharacterized membrane protein HdeD (DUF308 family)